MANNAEVFLKAVQELEQLGYQDPLGRQDGKFVAQRQAVDLNALISAFRGIRQLAIFQLSVHY